ncbi:MAG: CDP-glycerol glycerophosphotransferase family protein [Oscillospiraceae bacterium]|nr:CDP-glycerol glycerophosphotransferase family protein [Oscillospiraceae bacterium]
MNLRTLVKKNRAAARLAYALREKRNAAMLKKYQGLPLDPEKILFYRPDGGYGDNPRAIADYLRGNYPELKLVWACGGKRFFSSVPAGIKPVVFESDEYFRELATAGAWVSSTTLPFGTIKRKGQLYIQTWHGDKFLKKIANDARKDMKAYRRGMAARKFCEPELCDYFLTGCEWFVPIAASAFGYRGAFLRCGMPRNDCLVAVDEARCAKIRGGLGLDREVRVLIYAPTFRDYERTHDSVPSDIDLARILDALERKHGCRWMCLMRAHDGKTLTVNHDAPRDARFRDVTSYPDMADLLMISDMLISDYSSCGADFALTGKPVLLYQDDFARYTARGRTLYFPREESPYYTAANMEEALEIIRGITEEDARENCRKILDFYDSFESGRASEEVSRVILSALQSIRESQEGKG